MEENPFASPAEREREPAPEPIDEDDDETVRAAHIAREALVRSIGTLVVIAGWIPIGIGVWWVLEPSRATGAMVLAMATVIAIGALYVASGMLIRRLHPVGRGLATGLFALACLSSLSSIVQRPERIALGNVVLLVLLPLLTALLWSGRSRMVFSPRYRLEIVPATPRVRYRTPIWLWLLAGLLLLAVVGAALAGS
jgi:hypothetical protein